MQPPPNVKYNPFNQPKPPTGEFDWDVMGQSFEIIKAYPWIFIGFTFICGIGVTVISQLTNIPINMIMMNGGSSSDVNWGPILIGFGIAMIFSFILQMAAYGLILGGTMQMGVRFIQTRFIELTDGFSVIRKLLKLTGGLLLPYLCTLPFGILYLIIIGPQIFRLIITPNPSPESFIPILTSAIGVGVLNLVVSLVVYTLFSFIVPAMVVHEIGPVEAARRSFIVAKKNFGSILLMNIAFGFILLISALCCYLPLLFTVPWYANAILLQYVNLANIDLTGQSNPSTIYSPYPREQDSTSEMPQPPPPVAPETSHDLRADNPPPTPEEPRPPENPPNPEAPPAPEP